MGKSLNLENKIKKYLDVKHAILFNNGTSALHAALSFYNIGPGDEVIVPTLSYISSKCYFILWSKASILWMRSRTFNVEPKHIIEKITKKTKAIITVDLKGML